MGGGMIVVAVAKGRSDGGEEWGALVSSCRGCDSEVDQDRSRTRFVTGVNAKARLK
jgi:hypothetical protein